QTRATRNPRHTSCSILSRGSTRKKQTTRKSGTQSYWPTFRAIGIGSQSCRASADFHRGCEPPTRYFMEVWMNLSVFPARHSRPVSRLREPIPTFRYMYRVLAIITLFATLFTPQMATATVVVPVADTDMAQQASVIVIGKITKLKSAWDKNHQ